MFTNDTFIDSYINIQIWSKSTAVLTQIVTVQQLIGTFIALVLLKSIKTRENETKRKTKQRENSKRKKKQDSHTGMYVSVQVGIHAAYENNQSYTYTAECPHPPQPTSLSQLQLDTEALICNVRIRTSVCLGCFDNTDSVSIIIITKTTKHFKCLRHRQ